MIIINPTVVNGGNQISGGKCAEELREHVLVFRGKATTPALSWTFFRRDNGEMEPRLEKVGDKEEELHFSNGFHLL